MWVGLRLLFLIRYSLLAAILPVLLLLARYGNPELLRGVFVLDNPGQLFHVTWMSLLIAALVLVTIQVMLINAPARFSDYRAAGGAAPPPRRWRWRWLLLLLASLPIPIACLVDIQTDPSLKWSEWSSRVGLSAVWPLGLLVLLMGLLAGLLILMLLTAVEQLILRPALRAENLLPFETWRVMRWLRKIELPLSVPVGDWLAHVVNFFGPGYSSPYTSPQTGQPDVAPTGRPRLVLAPGHAQLLLWFGVPLLAYGITWAMVPRDHAVFEDNPAIPALFYVLVVVLFVGAWLEGMAFLLDYYRVPVLLTLVLAGLAVWSLARTDHYYRLNPDDKPLPMRPDLDFQTAIANHPCPPVVPKVGSDGPKRTLVIVTAAGGGIQADAWTAQVLTGLDELYGPDFTKSIGLISAVSGGSVGTMHFIVNGKWEAGEPFDAAARAHINEVSRRSGLEATGWGVAYPDLLRGSLPFLAREPYMDRGWALEESWRQLMPDGDVRVADWIEPTRAGKMPAVVFNATLAETGQRLLISPVLGARAPVEDPAEARDFYNLYRGDGPNPRVVTAVRLSATFPYVSPMPRPYRDGGRQPSTTSRDYHLADGGYSDNEGAFTVVEWLARLLADYWEHPEKKRPFDRVLVIRIQPFAAAKEREADTKHGWLYEVAGPITAIENVRTASQVERNSLALQLLLRLSEAHSGHLSPEAVTPRNKALEEAASKRLKQASLLRTLARDPQKKDDPRAREVLEQLQNEQQRAVQAAAEAFRELVAKEEITWTSFVFPSTESGPPQSWKLTKKQQDAITDAWKTVRQRTKPGTTDAVPNGLVEHPLDTIDRFFRPGQ